MQYVPTKLFDIIIIGHIHTIHNNYQHSPLGLC
jgi:hypothetical protein